FGRYSWGTDLQIPAATFQPDSRRVQTDVQQAMISNTRIFSSSAVNEARVSWNQFRNDLIGYFGNNENVQEFLNINGLFAASPLAYGLPEINLGNGLSGFGGVTPWVTRNNAFQFADN